MRNVSYNRRLSPEEDRLECEALGKYVMTFGFGVSVSEVFRAFRYRNYRFFFSGQLTSLMGTWTQQVALGWLVYRLTNSPLMLGFVAFSSQIPTFFISPFAGAIADRFDRRKLLLCIQTLSMVQALALAALVLSGVIRTWHIAALSLFIGILNAFDIPIRQSFVISIVEKKEDLGNAIILNSAIFTSARFIGPSVAGILISAFGEGVCFLLNAISYMGILIALAAIRVPRKEARARKTPSSARCGKAFLTLAISCL